MQNLIKFQYQNLTLKQTKTINSQIQKIIYLAINIRSTTMYNFVKTFKSKDSFMLPLFFFLL